MTQKVATASKMKSRQKTTFLHKIPTVTSEAGGLAYFVTNLKTKMKSFWSFPCALNSASKNVHLLMTVEGLFSMVIPGLGILLGILCSVVPPGSPNPDPSSDQNMPFCPPVFRLIHTHFQIFVVL